MIDWEARARRKALPEAVRRIGAEQLLPQPYRQLWGAKAWVSSDEQAIRTPHLKKGGGQ